MAGVRVDKWLQVARVFKTRSQATRACNLGRVSVNSVRAKPHRPLSLEDKVEIEITRDWTRVLVVKKLESKTLPKAMAREVYDDESPPRPELDRIQRLMRRRPVEREKGSGRPTKRDRRRLERFTDRSNEPES